MRRCDHRTIKLDGEFRCRKCRARYVWLPGGARWVAKLTPSEAGRIGGTTYKNLKANQRRNALELVEPRTAAPHGAIAEVAMKQHPVEWPVPR